MVHWYDGFLFGNGLTVYLLSLIKERMPKDLGYLLDIDTFLYKLSKSCLYTAEKELFQILYAGKSSHRGDFQRLKEEIYRYYARGGSSNIEYEYGKFLYLREKGAKTYDSDIVMSVFPYLYNFWYNWTYHFLMENCYWEDIRRFYQTIGRCLSKNAKIFTTNFDQYAEMYFPHVQHIHGKFIQLRKLEDLNYVVDGKIEYETIWGYNGLRKWEEILRRRTDSRYDFSFFFDNTLKIRHLLIFGLSFKRAAYVSKEFLEQSSVYKENYDKACMIDGHILERIRDMQNAGNVGEITISYYYQEELAHLSRVLNYYGLKHTRFVPYSKFPFTI